MVLIMRVLRVAAVARVGNANSGGIDKDKQAKKSKPEPLGMRARDCP